MPRDRRSTGELISTFCFAGVGLWLLGEALATPMPKGAILGLCALSCLAGAARHPLARLLERARTGATVTRKVIVSDTETVAESSGESMPENSTSMRP